MTYVKILCIAVVLFIIENVECVNQKTLFDFLPPHPNVQQQNWVPDTWEQASFVNGYSDIQNTPEVITNILKYYDENNYIVGLPHLAILRTIDAQNHLATVHKVLFLSGLGAERSIERIQSKFEKIFSADERAILLQSCCTIKECGYTTSDAKNIAHSEVAIGLYLKKLNKANYQTIQIKNAWNMCENCKNFWSGKVQINNANCIGSTGTIFCPNRVLGKFRLRVHIYGQNKIIGY